jgi:hypothetical protein
LEEVKKEEQTTIETLLVRNALGHEDLTIIKKAFIQAQKAV